MTELLNGMHPMQQLELCGAISRWMKPPGQLALPMPMPMPASKNVFQVEHNPNEEAVLMSAQVDHVFIGEVDNHQHIILDTGSSYNLIGRHIIPILEEKMKEAGTKMIVQPAGKRFQFGGTVKSCSTAKVLVPLLLGKTRVETEVYIVDTDIPFLLGGNFLRQHKTEISVSDNTLIINNHMIPLLLLATGHMAIPWESEIHKINRHDTVLMTVTVHENKWGAPAVKEAMHKQQRTLKECGVYKEVQIQPWLPTLPSKWIINATTSDDVEMGGAVTARLTVQGYQDLNDEYTPYTNPNARPISVRLMIATAANLGWKPKTINISKTNKHGQESDNTIPPPEIAKPGIAWKLLRGQYVWPKRGWQTLV